MKNPKSTAALTAVQREDHERVRLKEISLTWAKIAREKAKEDFFTRNGVGAMTHELDGIPPAHAITICLDVEPCDVELAFATNGTSLRRATLTALLAAMVVDEAAASDGGGPI
jgi:hypothetical protein